MQRNKRVLAIYRAPQFSPNSVQVDKEVMDAVCSQLAARSFLVEKRVETELTAWDLMVPNVMAPDLVLTMGRLPATLGLLRAVDCPVINSPDSVSLCCHRSKLNNLLATYQLPVAPHEGNDGYWLKRGKGCAECRDDVVFCSNRIQLQKQLTAFHHRGLTDVDISAHQLGDVVKFYGVAGTPFFRYYYSGEGGRTKYGQEFVNGSPHHYAFSDASLQLQATHAALLTDTWVYGGDAVVHADGTFHLIDFNDWPSFSRCREEAAAAIGGLADWLTEEKKSSRQAMTAMREQALGTMRQDLLKEKGCKAEKKEAS